MTITLSPEISCDVTEDGDYQFEHDDIRRGAKATFLISARSEADARKQLVSLLDALDKFIIREGEDAHRT